MSQIMKAPASGVTVRMYRHGFGDCFLLAFRDKNGKAKYMLIDCGLHHRVDEARDRIKKTLASIRDACGGHLHVLAVSHEHTDHVSGFQHAYDIFDDDKLKVDRVWLSWAEDENNQTAKILKKKYGKDEEAVTIAFGKLKAVDRSLAMGISHMPSFSHILPAAGSGKTTEEAMKFIKTLGRLEYCYPGRKPKKLDDVDGIRIFTLGPPESLKMIRMDEKSSEMYLRGLWTDQDTAFRVEVVGRFGNLPHEENTARERCRPFKPEYTRDDSAVKQDYYDDPKYDWRTIDNTWLEAAGELALKLESHRNNTSLVLAIEIVRSGKVLLFPGDAQAGNWLSWGDVEWKFGNKKVTGADLLKRTVLYKTGHHGSHNATLRGKGLELMTSPDLVAMIPVDESFAKQQGRLDSDGKPRGWKMPYEKLMSALEQKTRGRVLRADSNIPKQNQTSLTAHEWAAFKKDTKGSGPAYLQFTVEE
jgi:beta-lactamase superfamily II metal-dependent hydrolase